MKDFFTDCLMQLRGGLNVLHCMNNAVRSMYSKHSNGISTRQGVF